MSSLENWSTVSRIARPKLSDLLWVDLFWSLFGNHSMFFRTFSMLLFPVEFRSVQFSLPRQSSKCWPSHRWSRSIAAVSVQSLGNGHRVLSGTSYAETFTRRLLSYTTAFNQSKSAFIHYVINSFFRVFNGSFCTLISSEKQNILLTYCCDILELIRPTVRGKSRK